MILRYALFVFGVYITTIGIVMIVRCALGTTPVASLNYVLSINASWTLGTWMFIFNILLIAGQLILLGKRITPQDKLDIALQFPSAFVFSGFLDLNMYLFREMYPVNYLHSLFLLLAGCFIQSLGLSLSLKPHVTLLSADAFVRYASERFQKKFSVCKIGFDISVVALAVLISLLFTRQIHGVREGSVIAACINGYIVGFLNQKVITQRNIRKVLRHSFVGIRNNKVPK